MISYLICLLKVEHFCYLFICFSVFLIMCYNPFFRLLIKRNFSAFIKPHPSLRPFWSLLYSTLFVLHSQTQIDSLSLAYQCSKLDKLHLPASQTLRIERTEENEKPGKQDGHVRKLEQRQASLPFHHSNLC